MVGQPARLERAAPVFLTVPTLPESARCGGAFARPWPCSKKL